MKKYVIFISARTYLGIIIGIIGFVLLLQGLGNVHYIRKIKQNYCETDNEAGRYVECYITKERLLGRKYREMNGKEVFSPIIGIGAYTNNQRFIFMTNEKPQYYITLEIPDIYHDKIQQMLEEDGASVQLYGKIVTMKQELCYDELMDCLKIDDHDKIDNLVSAKHMIKVVDLDHEIRILYEGIALIIVGMLLLCSCVERKEIK